MKFICLICAERVMEDMTEEEQEEHYAEYREFTEEIKKGGHFISGNRLKPSADAITVRVRDGKGMTTDGPFAETKEQLAGYFMVEARDREQAVALAARIPGAASGHIEVREVMP
ncbi:MAG: YciI family protein, partial [Candidatus Omnitrophica bacterium]|nr:YciI family protein [Candidatus Omnitrophota bacterium]